jgi:acetyl-CoA synthetase
MPPRATFVDQYSALHSQFHWKVPKNFNIAQACAPKTQYEALQTALILEQPGQPTQTWRYQQLWRASQRLANAFVALGVKKGDRIAIVLPQCAQTAVAHLAAYSVGAVAMPMSILFGPDALAFRLENSQTRIAIIDADYLQNLHQALDESPQAAAILSHIVIVGAEKSRPSYLQSKQHSWDSLLQAGSDSFKTEPTLATDPAVLIYTSGTTGQPKGALIPHQALIGNLTGFVASQNWFPQPRDVFWSPADWAWTGGLMDALLPSLYFKKPIVGFNGRFSPQADAQSGIHTKTALQIAFTRVDERWRIGWSNAV